jgi:hypothetical protein
MKIAGEMPPDWARPDAKMPLWYSARVATSRVIGEQYYDGCF